MTGGIDPSVAPPMRATSPSVHLPPRLACALPSKGSPRRSVSYDEISSLSSPVEQARYSSIVEEQGISDRQHTSWGMQPSRAVDSASQFEV